MENNIIGLVIGKLNDEDLWFTQKTDPTWGNPSHYYKLDEYGDPTDSAIKEIEKEVKSYIGDGAVDETDAVDIWLQDAMADYRVAYTSSLVTKFKDKPIVDGIEAYTSQVMKENKELNETAKKLESISDLAKNANIKIGTCPYCNSKNLEYENDKQPVVAEYNDYVSYGWHCKDCGKDGQEVFGMDFIGQDLYRDDENDTDTDFVSKTENAKKTENYKRRLKEENSKSANLISQMFQADDFDSDSKSGQIVMRTSELFNALSDKGYDVQVAFDNGESTNTILLGQQGGQVIITITDTNQPLRAFSSGNFEITDENIKVLTDIKDQISAI